MIDPHAKRQCKAASVANEGLKECSWNRSREHDLEWECQRDECRPACELEAPKQWETRPNGTQVSNVVARFA